ncbi:MAG: tRNA (adenosine(37)-N6)-dimethylallyltransferase MiaA, partial [Planctomycetota bacterium]
MILALVGQTASGKNRAAVEAVTSANLPVEIISMDSMKLYRGMDVGTAKPDAGLRACVPHHL